MSAFSEEEFEPLDRRSVNEPLIVYRAVRVDRTDHPRLARAFRSDRERNRTPVEREMAIPELRDGMSVYRSVAHFCEMWRSVKAAAERRGQVPEMGEFMAEVELQPGRDFFIEDLGHDDGHMTLWGDRQLLAAAVKRIYPATDKCR